MHTGPELERRSLPEEDLRSWAGDTVAVVASQRPAWVHRAYEGLVAVLRNDEEGVEAFLAARAAQAQAPSHAQVVRESLVLVCCQAADSRRRRRSPSMVQHTTWVSLTRQMVQRILQRESQAASAEPAVALDDDNVGSDAVADGHEEARHTVHDHKDQLCLVLGPLDHASAEAGLPSIEAAMSTVDRRCH